ncbi:hypothetical protein DIREPILLOW8_100 [Vibrio phage Direpillow8]|uniref:Uncharacterized protein n=5 Tax=Thalassavirus TaxID=2948922 RepID=A0A4Y6E7T3_9CAUD|nr:hypothetical protein KNU52_gp183 [Vibrio phage Achelous]YP_010102524.1 hypothetical protein KNU58_gp181 [Vibrio phage Brizo]YP_010107944.1 hypothetical protein KNV05_gp197 [Vibrio phage River4]YP_010108523.1 hypothetical protein KNV08_gp197 [Vibrio phage Quinn]YP_010114267.1 hypothetical protein KNV71_gp199 [Vibrio phage Gary]QKN85537.1 hypothetical protein DIREPILLOW8_100 [Vibrio phage Direpillow8]QQO89731.1 hypothetical protein GRLPWR_98 [Vibrio phage GRLPWR]WBF69462.1 hypothetical prot
MYYQGERIVIKRYDPTQAQKRKLFKRLEKKKLVEKVSTEKEWLRYKVLRNFDEVNY